MRQKHIIFRVICTILLITFSFQQAAYAAPVRNALAPGDEHRPGPPQLAPFKDATTGCVVGLQNKTGKPIKLKAQFDESTVTIPEGPIVIDNQAALKAPGFRGIRDLIASEMDVAIGDDGQVTGSDTAEFMSKFNEFVYLHEVGHIVYDQIITANLLHTGDRGFKLSFEQITVEEVFCDLFAKLTAGYPNITDNETIMLKYILDMDGEKAFDRSGQLKRFVHHLFLAESHEEPIRYNPTEANHLDLLKELQEIDIRLGTPGAKTNVMDLTFGGNIGLQAALAIKSLEGAVRLMAASSGSGLPADKGPVDLRTCDDIMREMYGRQGNLFRNMGSRGIMPLFEQGRHSEVVDYIENELVRLAQSDDIKYNPLEINLIRCAWGEWLFENDHSAEALVLLKAAIPGENSPYAYQMMYHHLTGEVHRDETVNQLSTGNTQNALNHARQATVFFKNAGAFSNLEEQRLEQMHIDPSLEKERQRALENINKGRHANRQALDTSNCGIIAAVIRMQELNIVESHIPETVKAANELLERHGAGELENTQLEILQTNIGALYTNLVSAGRKIPSELSEIFYRVVATAPEGKISIPGHADIEVITPSKTGPKEDESVPPAEEPRQTAADEEISRLEARLEELKKIDTSEAKRAIRVIKARLKIARARIIAKTNNKAGRSDVKPPSFWTGWGTRERRHGDKQQPGESFGTTDMSDSLYKAVIDPFCAEKIQPLLQRLNRNFGKVVLVDIFAGAGDFVNMVHHRTRGDIPSEFYLIERDSENVANARQSVGTYRNVVVIKAELGMGRDDVMKQLPARPNIVTSIGGISRKIVTQEDAYAIAKQVYDLLPEGGIFVVSGLSECHLGKKGDFESIGFRVQQWINPGITSDESPNHFFVLVKPSIITQLSQTIVVEGIEDWKEITARAQQFAEDKHPNLLAALEVVNLGGYAGLDTAQLTKIARDLSSKHGLTSDESNVVRVCLGLPEAPWQTPDLDQKGGGLPAENISPVKVLTELGQRIWIDGVDREFINDPEGLAAFIIKYGASGITTNPSLYDAAFKNPIYAAQIEELAEKGLDNRQIYFELVKKDVQDALRVGREHYGPDFKFSVELDPDMAKDVEASVEEGKLWAAIDMEGVMLKVAADEEGGEEACEIIKRLTALGINVNATLIFTPEEYERVAWAYIEGLEEALRNGVELSTIYSVASFFISRWDVGVRGDEFKDLYGDIANSIVKTAYNDVFKRIFTSKRFKALQEHGARIQGFLLASTGSKWSKFVEELGIDEAKRRFPEDVYMLVGGDTVDTLPKTAIVGFHDSGKMVTSATIEENVADARATLATASDRGLDIKSKGKQLYGEGLGSFKRDFASIFDVRIESIAGPVRIAQQLRKDVADQGGMGWVALAQRAQELAGERHPNLVAALKIVEEGVYTGVPLDQLQTEAETLAKQHELNDGQARVVRLCLGLDWPQGGGLPTDDGKVDVLVTRDGSRDYLIRETAATQLADQDPHESFNSGFHSGLLRDALARLGEGTISSENEILVPLEWLVMLGRERALQLMELSKNSPDIIIRPLDELINMFIDEPLAKGKKKRILLADATTVDNNARLRHRALVQPECSIVALQNPHVLHVISAIEFARSVATEDEQALRDFYALLTHGLPFDPTMLDRLRKNGRITLLTPRIERPIQRMDELLNEHYEFLKSA